MTARQVAIAALGLLLSAACGDDSSSDSKSGGASGAAGAAAGSTSKGGSTGSAGQTPGGSAGNAAGGGGSGAVGGDNAGGDGEGGDDPVGGSGGAGPGNPLCEPGCEATMAADCDDGPPSQQECVEDCQMLSAGPCGSEFLELQACGEGQEVTCSPQGIPVIAACPDETDAFLACIN